MHAPRKFVVRGFISLALALAAAYIFGGIARAQDAAKDAAAPADQAAAGQQQIDFQQLAKDGEQALKDKDWDKALASYDPLVRVSKANVQAQIAEIQADKKMKPAEKKQLVDDLNEQLKTIEPIKNQGNIALVEKYYDKLAALQN